MATFHILQSTKIALADVTANDVHLVDVVRLPFRFRVPGIFRFTDQDVDLILRNRLPIELGESTIDLMCKRKTDLDEVQEAMSTDALFVAPSPELSAEELTHLRRGDASKLNFLPHSLRSAHLLNEFTVAYLSCGFDPFGTQAPRLLINMDFFRSTRVHAVAVRSKGERLSDDDAIQLFDLSGPSIGTVSTHGELHDLATGVLDALLPAAFAAQRRHVFYEFAVRSQAALELSEFQVALLMACVALEGAHAAFLQFVLAERFAELGSAREELIANLLREQGFHTMFRVTLMLFLEPSERPDAKLVDRCKKAIEIRNEIMHAKSKSGKYKIRQRSMKELIDAQSAALKMFGVFDAVLKRHTVTQNLPAVRAD